MMAYVLQGIILLSCLVSGYLRLHTEMVCSGLSDPVFTLATIPTIPTNLNHQLIAAMIPGESLITDTITLGIANGISLFSNVILLRYEKLLSNSVA